MKGVIYHVILPAIRKGDRVRSCNNAFSRRQGKQPVLKLGEEFTEV
jgi:hypothetical protein